ncbi:MAG: hypothetical protein WBR15_03215 [Gammaproteobacteria bacterium]
MGAYVTCILNWLEAYSGVITAIATLMIGGFTYTLWRSTRKLWKEAEASRIISKDSADAAKGSADAAMIAAEAAKKSADALPRIERPYIFVDGDKHTLSGNMRYTELVFKNYGKTPAIITRIQTRLVRKVEGEPNKPDYLSTPISVNIVIESTSGWAHREQPSQYLDIRWYYGCAEYKDIFGDIHKTWFGFNAIPGHGNNSQFGGDEFNGYD